MHLQPLEVKALKVAQRDSFLVDCAVTKLMVHIDKTAARNKDLLARHAELQEEYEAIKRTRKRDAWLIVMSCAGVFWLVMATLLIAHYW